MKYHDKKFHHWLHTRITKEQNKKLTKEAKKRHVDKSTLIREMIDKM